MIYLSAFADEAADSLQGQIEALNRNGISYLEIRTIDGKNVKDFTLEEARKYAKELKENGIKVFSIGSPLGKVDIDVDFSDYLQTVRRVCELANVFETKRVRVFSFYNSLTKREKVILYLNEMVKVAKEYGVELYHENEKEIYGDISKRVDDILQNVSGLKSVYDPSNYLFCSELPEQTEYLQKKADYFHIKDSIFGTSEIVPAGYGDGKIDEIIKNISGDKVLSLEPHLRVFNAYSQIDTTKLKHKFHYGSNAEAFDVAVTSIKTLLIRAGYIEKNGVFIK